MTGAEAAEFASRLRRWYRRRRRPLPWRKTADPYRIWISEIMLQQTTVEAVIPYYRRWVKKYPTVRRLDRAPLSRILRDWQGLGYYQRARNLKAAARMILSRHGGRIPASVEQLRRLPGIGPYTAAAILSLAYDRPLPVLEANVRRVMMRILRLRGRRTAQVAGRIESVLSVLVPRRGAGLFNQSLMELGALVCRPASPRCTSCPVTSFCEAYKRGEQEIIPPRRKSSGTHHLRAVVAVIGSKGRVFIQQRPPTGLLAGLWEFPGGKVEPGESNEDALRREIREELGIALQETVFLVRVKHAYTKYRVDLWAYLCRAGNAPQPSADRRWVRTASLRNYAFPSGSARIVDRLMELENSGKSAGIRRGS